MKGICTVQRHTHWNWPLMRKFESDWKLGTLNLVPQVTPPRRVWSVLRQSATVTLERIMPTCCYWKYRMRYAVGRSPIGISTWPSPQHRQSRGLTGESWMMHSNLHTGYCTIILSSLCLTWIPSCQTRVCRRKAGRPHIKTTRSAPLIRQKRRQDPDSCGPCI